MVFVCCLCVKSVFGVGNEALQMEKQEYEQDLSQIESFRKSLRSGPINDINSFEKFADEIQSKWSRKNREYYARLMWEICGPLSSGRFNDERQHDLAREYALSALAEPNEIPLETELELIGHVMTDTVTPRAPTGQEWVQRRKQDVWIRLHAWRRLTEAIDPTWDPNDLPYINVPLPRGTEGSSGMAPEDIKDPNLRAEYEAAIEKNRQKAEKYSEQYQLRKWLKRFPKRAEEYIIEAYSKPPFDEAELKQYMDKYITDTETKARILDAVENNIEHQSLKKY